MSETQEREKLRRLAEAATPGPYQAKRNGLPESDPWYVLLHRSEAHGGHFIGPLVESKYLVTGEEAQRAQMEYFAALDPQTVLALLDALREQEEVRSILTAMDGGRDAPLPSRLRTVLSALGAAGIRSAQDAFYPRTPEPTDVR